MNDKKFTACVRCGKPRVLLSTSEETIGTSVVVTTEAICPDPECQQKVSVMLDGERDRRMASANHRQEKFTKIRHDLKLATKTKAP